MEALEKLLFVVLGAVLSGLAYLLRRRIEKRPEFDALDKHQKLLNIHKEMSDRKISVEDLRLLEKALLRNASTTEKHAEGMQERLVPALKQGIQEGISQAGLTERASTRVKTAEAKLEQVVQELALSLEPESKDALIAAHKAWKVYSIRQAELVASGFIGGTIYPIVYYSELEALTISRIAALQNVLTERVCMIDSPWL
jgi:uncharacterized protein YecT (DUF1311 family)